MTNSYISPFGGISPIIIYLCQCSTLHIQYIYLCIYLKIERTNLVYYVQREYLQKGNTIYGHLYRNCWWLYNVHIINWKDWILTCSSNRVHRINARNSPRISGLNESQLDMYYYIKKMNDK